MGNKSAHWPYTSVKHPASVEHIIKKSRFIADVFPVTSEETTLAALDMVRDQYPDASHICYAYKCGLDTDTVRFSDAGEPGGTAGRPILEVIEREGLRNTLVVVTRYFGGILLGASGLVRAYSGAAALGIEAAGKATYKWHVSYKVTVDYAAWGRIEHLLRDSGYQISDLEYGAGVSFVCRVLPSMSDAWIQQLKDTTSGQVQVQEVGEGYHDI